nr:MAG TPA: hypothetical protein [Caudoviricetes sp.]
MDSNKSNEENRKADALRQKMEHIEDTEYLQASAQIVTALASYRSLICKI